MTDREYEAYKAARKSGATMEEASMTAYTHTPTPWRVTSTNDIVSNDCQTRIAACFDAMEALHIVRCANSHDALVAALRDIVSCVRVNGPAGTTAYIIRDAIMSQARAALKLADEP